jgi:hypothetical protein
LGQSRNLFEGPLQQLGHDANLPDGSPFRYAPGSKSAGSHFGAPLL